MLCICACLWMSHSEDHLGLNCSIFNLQLVISICGDCLKLYLDFWLCRGPAPLTSMLFKSQLYFVGGLYYSSVLKSIVLLVIDLGDELRPICFSSAHFFNISSRIPSSQGFYFSPPLDEKKKKKSFSRNYIPYVITQFHTPWSIFEMRCQVIREKK